MHYHATCAPHKEINNDAVNVIDSKKKSIQNNTVCDSKSILPCMSGFNDTLNTVGVLSHLLGSGTD